MVSEDSTRRQKNCRQIVFCVNPVPKSRGGIFSIFCLHPTVINDRHLLNLSFRQLLLPELSVQSQLKMKSSNGVLIVGAGGLGCPAAMYLAAAGVARIGIVDHDVVELSNLNRQVKWKTQMTSYG